jgi:hypothetical protein
MFLAVNSPKTGQKWPLHKYFWSSGLFPIMNTDKILGAKARAGSLSHCKIPQALSVFLTRLVGAVISPLLSSNQSGGVLLLGNASWNPGTPAERSRKISAGEIER